MLSSAEKRRFISAFQGALLKMCAQTPPLLTFPVCSRLTIECELDFEVLTINSLDRFGDILAVCRLVQ